jgi:hypothetical protein
MSKWWRRPFAKSQAPADEEDLEKNQRFLDETTILNLVLAQGLGRKIADELRNHQGWPFDLGNGNVDDREEIALSLWWFSKCISQTVREATFEEKSRILDALHAFAYRKLVDLGQTPSAVNDLSFLVAKRYGQYHPAYDVCWQRLRKSELTTWGPFTRIVTENLFGTPSNDIAVDVLIGINLQSSLLAFAATLAPRWTSLAATLDRLAKANRSSGDT